MGSSSSSSSAQRSRRLNRYQHIGGQTISVSDGPFHPSIPTNSYRFACRANDA